MVKEEDLVPNWTFKEIWARYKEPYGYNTILVKITTQQSPYEKSKKGSKSNVQR